MGGVRGKLERRAAIAAAALALAVALPACGGGGGGGGGNNPGECDAGKPSANPRVQADYCGVSAIEVVRKGALTRAPSVGVVRIDLYIDDPHHSGLTCGFSSFIADALCGVNDARGFVPQGSPDPQADPSRDRVEGLFDFGSGDITFRVNPSCSVAHHSGSIKDCHAPHPDGQGTDVSVSRLPGNQTRVDTTFTESAYAIPGGVCAIHNYFVIAPDPDSGDFTLSGHGASFPSISIIHAGRVVLADQGVHSTSLCFPVGTGGRDYDHSPPPAAAKPPPRVPSTGGAIPVPSTGGASGSDFTARANAICKKYVGQLAAVPTPGSDTQSTLNYNAQAGPIFAAMVSALHGLTPPPSEAADFSRYLALMDHLVSNIHQVVPAIQNGDDQTVRSINQDTNYVDGQAQEIAKRLQLQQCTA